MAEQKNPDDTIIENIIEDISKDGIRTIIDKFEYNDTAKIINFLDYNYTAYKCIDMTSMDDIKGIDITIPTSIFNKV